MELAPQQVDGPAIMVEVVKAIHQRGWWVACNPKDEKQAVASMEEVFENEAWIWPELPPLITHPRVPEGRIGFYDDSTKTLTGLVEVVTKSETGLGRIGKLHLPNGSLRGHR